MTHSSSCCEKGCGCISSTLNGTDHETGTKKTEILDARAGTSSRRCCVNTFHSVCVSELQSTELLVDGQDVMVELSREQQVLQGSHVLLDGHVVLRNEQRHELRRRRRGNKGHRRASVYHEEDLLQSLDAVFVPGRADVHAAGLTTDQMLRQQHDETLREDEQRASLIHSADWDGQLQNKSFVPGR